MSTLDVLNAISEAHAALVKLPELNAIIAALTDERDFVKLERDEAELTIQRLKARITELETSLHQAKEEIYSQSAEIRELTDRNATLDQSHRDLITAHDNAQLTIRDQFDRIHILNADKAALNARLEDAKGYGVKLSETLRSIGQSIVAAVEVPEVTPAAPFPVANPVGLSNPSNHEPNGNISPVVDPVVAEPAGATVESVKDTAAGCYPYRYW